MNLFLLFEMSSDKRISKTTIPAEGNGAPPSSSVLCRYVLRSERTASETAGVNFLLQTTFKIDTSVLASKRILPSVAMQRKGKIY